MTVYTLISTDLTGLLDSRDSEKPTEHFREVFSDITKAKARAEKHYGKSIRWEKSSKGYTSGDLFYVMYDIEKTNVK